MEEENEAKWNIDGAEHEYLFELKLSVSLKLRAWDLEGAYWDLRTFRAEIDAMLKRDTGKKAVHFKELEGKEEQEEVPEGKESEKAEIDRMIKELDDVRGWFNSIRKPTDIDKSIFRVSIENLYLILCRMIKKHGIYFREGGDNKLAVMRR